MNIDMITIFYSAFPVNVKALHSVLFPRSLDLCINSALKVPFLHSLGSIPASRDFTGGHMPTQTQELAHPTLSPFIHLHAIA